jgi:hypothetical protein
MTNSKELYDDQGYANPEVWEELLAQAKAKHKDEVTDAYGDGLNAYRVEFCNRDEYYDKVYGGDQ